MQHEISGKISHISYCLPDYILDNSEINQKFPEWSIEKIEGKTGIKQRHIAAKSETALDLGINAARKLITEFDNLRNDIDGLLFCTQSPDYALPPNACIAQDILGLRKDIPATDFSLGCSGFVFGLSIAQGWIQSNQAKCILLITAETYSKYIANEDKTVKTIFGDAGAATIISSTNTNAINKFSFYTDGSGYKNLIVPQSGCAKLKINASSDAFFNNLAMTSENLYMNGPEIFKFTLAVVPKLLNDCIFKSDIQFDDIDYFIFHQANQFMLDNLRIKCKIPKEKFIIEMSDVGNTVSCTIPIALKRCIDRGLIKSGNRVFVAGFGVGYSACATIITI